MFKKWVIPIFLVVLGLFLGSVGIYIGEIDDSPGAGGLGMILALICLCFAIKQFRKYLR